MSKRSRILLVMIGLIELGVVAFWPGTDRPRAYANVTLVSFTANSLAGQPEVFIQWETATEFDTLGFFITRSDSAAGSFARVSDFIPNEGDTITGAQYDWIDYTTVLSHTYSYTLEEITRNQLSEFYGPITVTAGIPATATPTATASPSATRTPTRTPTNTPTPSATTKVEPTTSRTGGSFATPQLATGSTVTPRPTVINAVAANPASTAAPLVFDTATPVPANNIVPQPVSVIATPVPVVSSGSTGNQVTPVPTIMTVAQAPEPSPASAAVAEAQVAPVVVVTEAGPSSTAENPANTPIPLLLIAAIVLLGGGSVILLRARK